jgi:catechol 2,3-dioxygenase-like lactoylglutathione lyase family enzyme
VDLDHVAVATRDVTDALRVLVEELGATVLSGGQMPGFRPMQVRLGDEAEGMTVELLEPWEPTVNDFLARFLDRHGDGPHHLTFKADDFDAALDAVRATGRDPVGINRADPMWLEAFVLPRDGFGTVVQIAAQAPDYPFASRFGFARAHGPEGAPAWWPPVGPRAPEAVRLRQVVLRVEDLPGASAFFGDVLGGAVVGDGGDFVELRWPGGAQLRLERGEGTGGIVRLELDGPPRDLVIAGTRFVAR